MEGAGEGIFKSGVGGLDEGDDLPPYSSQRLAGDGRAPGLLPALRGAVGQPKK